MELFNKTEDDDFRGIHQYGILSQASDSLESRICLSRSFHDDYYWKKTSRDIKSISQLKLAGRMKNPWAGYSTFQENKRIRDSAWDWESIPNKMKFTERPNLYTKHYTQRRIFGKHLYHDYKRINFLTVKS